MNSIFKILGLACVAVMLVGIYVKIGTNVGKEIITVNIPYCDYYWRERNGHAKGGIVENTCSFRNPDQGIRPECALTNQGGLYTEKRLFGLEWRPNEYINSENFVGQLDLKLKKGGNLNQSVIRRYSDPCIDYKQPRRMVDLISIHGTDISDELSSTSKLYKTFNNYLVFKFDIFENMKLYKMKSYFTSVSGDHYIVPSSGLSIKRPIFEIIDISSLRNTIYSQESLSKFVEKIRECSVLYVSKNDTISETLQSNIGGINTISFETRTGICYFDPDNSRGYGFGAYRTYEFLEYKGKTYLVTYPSKDSKENKILKSLIFK